MTQSNTRGAQTRLQVGMLHTVECRVLQHHSRARAIKYEALVAMQLDVTLFYGLGSEGHLPRHHSDPRLQRDHPPILSLLPSL